MVIKQQNLTPTIAIVLAYIELDAYVITHYRYDSELTKGVGCLLFTLTKGGELSWRGI